MALTVLVESRAQAKPQKTLGKDLNGNVYSIAEQEKAKVGYLSRAQILAPLTPKHFNTNTFQGACEPP